MNIAAQISSPANRQLVCLQRVNLGRQCARFFIAAAILGLSFNGLAHKVDSAASPSAHHSSNSPSAPLHDVSLHQGHEQVAMTQAQLEALIKQYSLTGNDAVLAEAWLPIAASLQADSPKTQDLLNAAWIAQAEHKFKQSLSYIDKVIDQQPNSPPAWMLKAAIHTVLGEVPQAQLACQKTALLISPVVSIACQARLAETSDERNSAFKTMASLADANLAGEYNPWIYSVAADLAASLNHLEQARRWYQKSIATFPSVQVRAAYADLLLTNQQYAVVLELVPEQNTTPALRIRRLLAAQALGRDVAAEVSAIDTLFRQWIAQSDFRHAREMAIFFLELADDPVTAHQLAQENIKFQAEPEDRKLLLKTKHHLQMHSSVSKR